MTARPGGEADKFGVRYEGRWTVRNILYVLRGIADSIIIIIEEVDDIGEGVEFRVRRNSHDEVHQVKRWYSKGNAWTVAALRNEGVLDAARSHVAAGRQFHFVSMTPFSKLATLANRARQSASLNDYRQNWLTEYLHPVFNDLSADNVYGSYDVAWQTLRGIYVH